METAFHSRAEQYRTYEKRSIEKAIQEGRIAPEDVKLIKMFLAEANSTGDLSPQRKFKLACNLMNAVQYLPPVKDLALPDVYDARDSIKTATRADGKPYTKNTVADLIRILKRYVVWLAENDHVKIDLQKLKKTVKVPAYISKTKTEDAILTEEEVLTLINAPHSLRYRALLGVLYEGGLRIHEVAAMRWSDVIFSEWGCRIRTAGKTEKERTIPVIAYRELLAKWRTEHPDPRPDNLVFLNYHNKPLKYQSIAQTITKFAEDAGIEKHVTPHILRHSRITHVLRRGMQETLAKKCFWGNENSDMLKVYAHLTTGDAEVAFARMAGVEIPDDDEQSAAMDPVQCSQCHTINPPGTRFCGRCGMPQVVEAAESLNMVIRAAEAVVANPNDPEALTILLEARARMSREG